VYNSLLNRNTFLAFGMCASKLIALLHSEFIIQVFPILGELGKRQMACQDYGKSLYCPCFPYKGYERIGGRLTDGHFTIFV